MLDPGLPPAPKIDGEAMLEVFVHRSLKLSGVPFKDGSPFVDGKRLAVIGKRTLEVVYLDLMFYKEPVLEAENLLVSSFPVSTAMCPHPYRHVAADRNHVAATGRDMGVPLPMEI